MELINKAALVAEIKRRKELVSDPILSGNDLMIGERNAYFNSLSFIDTIEVKEMDLDAFGVLAEHLLACDAHVVTPKYSDKELDLLEKSVVTKYRKENSMTAKCIRDWPSHFVNDGDLCKFEPCPDSFCVKFPLMGWTSIGERKFKRHFVIIKE